MELSRGEGLSVEVSVGERLYSILYPVTVAIELLGLVTGILGLFNQTVGLLAVGFSLVAVFGVVKVRQNSPPKPPGPPGH